jgi:hypothetical protein
MPVMRPPPRAGALAACLSVVSVVATGCGVPKTAAAPGALSPDQVAAATRRWPDATEAQLASGRATLTARCNHCHGYPDLDAVADERWPSILERMGKNAALDADQTQAVLRFVRAARKHR